MKRKSVLVFESIDMGVQRRASARWIVKHIRSFWVPLSSGRHILDERRQREREHAPAYASFFDPSPETEFFEAL